VQQVGCSKSGAYTSGGSSFIFCTRC
jgi:hypothetical protein